MGKLAFVFSGQGDQYSGMGKELYDKYKAAKSVFDMCDSIRANTSSQCFCGTDEELKETRNTQPCLFAMELSSATVLKEKGVKADVVAGFSLGEVVAATYAGLFSYETGFSLVCKRGELMQSESEKHDTSMAAIVKLSDEQVCVLCEKYDGIYPVNFNCPGQITVSGLSALMPEFFADVKNAGGRAIPLKVKGAFHSPFMNNAATAFGECLKEAQINEPKLELYSNVTAKPYEGDAVSLLSSQICSPVQWEKIVRNMIADGVDTFVEIGPGRTLTNMIRKINAEVKALTATDYLAEVGIC